MDFGQHLLDRADFKLVYWAHAVSVTELFARLHAFPEGLPGDRAKEREEAQAAFLSKTPCVIKALGQVSFYPITIPVKRAGQPEAVLLQWPRVVPGDVVHFKAGDILLADARIISGDSIVVEPPIGIRDNLISSMRQLSAQTEPSTCVYYEASNMIWGGSRVLRGHGIAIVCWTLDKMLVSNVGARILAGARREYDLSKRKTAIYKEWISVYGIAARREMHSFLLCPTKEDPSAFLSFIHLHWQSALLQVAPQSPPKVLSVLSGRKFHSLPKDEGLLSSLYKACAVLSTEWLNLEQIQQWNAGTRPLEKIECGGDSDALGAALLRFALAGSGATSFWSTRAAGFKVYRHGADATVVDSGFLALYEMQRVTAVFSHVVDPEKGRILLKSDHVERLEALVAEWKAKDCSIAIIGSYDVSQAADTNLQVSVPSNCTILAILVIQHTVQTLLRIKSAVTLLREARVSLILRCYDEKELPLVIEKAREIGILVPDLDPEKFIYRIAQGTAAQKEARRSFPIWVVPRKEQWGVRYAFRRRTLDEMAAPEGALDPNEEPEEDTEENSLIFYPKAPATMPWYSGLVPLAPNDVVKLWLWRHNDGGPWGNEFHRFAALGDTIIAADVDEQSYLWLLKEAFVLDPHDSYAMQCRPSPPHLKLSIIGHSELSSGANANASYILQHTDIARFASWILSIRNKKHH